ncbi:hypothetical protein DV736_g1909, partial [Chaetothyriales sp. CBS 134916]
MPLDSLFTTSDSPVSRSKSLLTRFSRPLSANVTRMFDLAIEPADPFKCYGPGEVVKGHVVLTVMKGFDITHLVVALHGYAKVYKHQIAPGDKPPVQERVVNGKGSGGFEFHGNGLASLFQEEQVLCRNGFLQKHVYKFAFELNFPGRSLPSSIEFERGTVSYMISATMTRPVALQPTHTRYMRIKFQDTIDIEPMNVPKSRVISLEPVNRRGKVKKVKHPASVATSDASNRHGTTRKSTQSSMATTTTPSPTTTTPVVNPPLSPAPSDDTFATATSSGSVQPVEQGTTPVRKSSPTESDNRSTATSSSAHTITATTELPRHGALPGDSIPVRVSVAHSKPFVRGVVIATLYRLTRVDMLPSSPLLGAAKAKDGKKDHEDLYKKSRTGLGGLYFASSSPNSVFRKDLSQSSTMMVVDPVSLTAYVSTSVRVPDDAFPTITNVPGGMISFTYHIEVVIDLFGKLGETRYLPRLTSSDLRFTSSEVGGNQLTNDWTNSILDTAQLRRTKRVVTFEMSVTVGTKDSSRKKRSNWPKDGLLQQESGQSEAQHLESPEVSWVDGWGYEGYDWYYDENGNPQLYDDSYPYGNGENGHEWHDYYPSHYPLSDPIPPPQPNEDIDEKTRLRLHEELLEPSQPPTESESSCDPAAALAPSAPGIEEIETRDLGQPPDGIAPPTPGPPASLTSARSADTIRPSSSSPLPPAPEGELAATEDKQELEMRRLMVQASSPPAHDDDQRHSGQRPAPPVAPSAPALTEGEDLYGAPPGDRRGSILPLYSK